MIRDVSRLTGRTFDVLVIGGGVYGLTIACDAAERGLSVALIERDDFGSGSSFNHLRTIHGGLRYLQSLDFARASESVRERRTLARIAPHTIQPLPFVLPLFRSLSKGKLAVRVGLAIDRFVARNRNADVPSSLRLPAGRVVSRAEAIARFPGLPRHGLSGAAIWYDYVTVEPDRLTWAWADAAVQHGAVIANYVEATSLLRDGARVIGVLATDRLGGAIDIHARITVNATGASLDRLLSPLRISTSMPLLKAMNLVTTRDAGPEALGGRATSGRHLFLVPWRGRALFGTWESARAVRPCDTGATEAEIALFLTELNQAFPGLDLTMGEISLVHRGLVPATVGPDGTVSLERTEKVHDHAVNGVEGLLSVAGTKYTTARAVAERVTDRLVAKLGRQPTPSRTAATTLPGGNIGDVAQAIADARREHDQLVPADTIPHLVAAYGAGRDSVLALAASRGKWADRLSGDSPVVGAELVWAARHEMAVALSDAVIRRTPLGALGHPGHGAAATAADIMGNELGWSEERKAKEIGELSAFYRIG